MFSVKSIKKNKFNFKNITEDGIFCSVFTFHFVSFLSLALSSSNKNEKNEEEGRRRKNELL
jgi:hypothetical protein